MHYPCSATFLDLGHEQNPTEKTLKFAQLLFESFRFPEEQHTLKFKIFGGL